MRACGQGPRSPWRPEETPHTGFSSDGAAVGRGPGTAGGVWKEHEKGEKGSRKSLKWELQRILGGPALQRQSS